jgi:Kdo2-lipid IVA lauroyltransferase/acyltransferase
VNKKIRRKFKYLLVKLIIQTFLALPRSFCLGLAKVLAPVAWHLMPKERAKVLFNLNLIFPERQDHQALGLEIYRKLALNAVDAVKLPGLPLEELDRLVNVHGLEHFDSAYKTGKGIVAVTGHIGCWELMPVWFSRHGYKISVIGKRSHDPRLDNIVLKMRSGQGIQVIDRDTGAREALKALHSGHALGILIDQDTRVSSVNVVFFGHQAKTPTGAAALADRAGSAVIPLAIQRDQNGVHHLYIRPPLLRSELTDKEARLREDVQRQTAALEDLIKQDVSQWVWMHLRWLEKPKA